MHAVLVLEWWKHMETYHIVFRFGRDSWVCTSLYHHLMNAIFLVTRLCGILAAQVCWCKCTTFQSLQIRRLRAWLYGNLLTFPLIALSPMMSTGLGDSTTKAPELHGIFLRTAYLFQVRGSFLGDYHPKNAFYMYLYAHPQLHLETKKIRKGIKKQELSPVSSATKHHCHHCQSLLFMEEIPNNQPRMYKTLYIIGG